MNIRFPRNTGQRYYDLHFKYMLAIFKELNWPVTFYDDDTGERGCFKMFLECPDHSEREVMVDFSDYGHEYIGDKPCLRFHYQRGVGGAVPGSNYYPFAPGSFWNWQQYSEYKSKLQYKAEGLVMHNQYPHCNNLGRRTFVRMLVEDWADKQQSALSKGKGYVDGRELNGAHTQYYGVKEYYWNSLSDCLVSIHVPGQNNNMLDSAQMQLMAFGYCTVSPHLPDVLPNWVELHGSEFKTRPNHCEYIQCADDYSDLHSIIDWCRENKASCLEIGKQAKAFFECNCTPRALGGWLEELLTSRCFE